jgi:hypothetical protein
VPEIASVIGDPREALNVMDFEEAAHRKVLPGHWAYIESGVDDDLTLRGNRDAYRRTTHQVIALDGRSGRAAADHAAALEDPVKLFQREGIGVGVDDVPLPATVEPDGVRIAKHPGELFAVGHLGIVRVQHEDIGRAALFPGGEHLFLFVDPYAAIRSPIAAGGRDHDDLRVQTAWLVDEGLEDACTHIRASTLDDQRPFRRPVFRGLRKRGPSQ